MTKRRLVFLLVAIIFLATCAVPAWAAQSDGWKTIPVKKLERVLVYTTQTWRLVGANDRTQKVDQWQSNHRDFDGQQGQHWQAMANEEIQGDWLSFQVEMKDGTQLYWSRNSRVILTTKDNKEVVGLACFFVANQIDGEVYDVRKTGIAVRKGIFEEGTCGPPVWVKYPRGTISGKMSSFVGVRVEGVLVREDSRLSSSR